MLQRANESKISLTLRAAVGQVLGQRISIAATYVRASEPVSGSFFTLPNLPCNSFEELNLKHILRETLLSDEAKLFPQNAPILNTAKREDLSYYTDVALF